MLSIIVCSRNSSKLAELSNNIAETIGYGIEYEIIPIHNHTKPRPIAEAYNQGASQAQYPYLLFIHEDAGFITNDWLPIIEKKLAEPDCGIIGFAGSKIMFNIPGGWGMDPKWMVVNVFECGVNIKINSDPRVAFTEVVTLDGYAMFVRRDVWQNNPFDEKLLRGFHCYDVDFSLQVSRGYKNYVCNSIESYHNSKGNFDKEWLKQTLQIYDEKWCKILPRTTSDLNIPDNDLLIMEERAFFRILKKLNRLKLSTRTLSRHFLKYPLRFRHAEHLLKLLFMKL